MDKIKHLFKRHTLPLLLITGLTLLVWGRLLSQTIQGEGYFYFNYGQNFINSRITIPTLETADVGAKILFTVIPPIFKDNIVLYLAFQLLIMVILFNTFYLVIVYFTKNRYVASVSAIIFSTSYIGLFEMLGTGNYQRFVQRVPYLIPLFLAFYLFGKYLRDNQKIHLYFSYLIFTIAVLLAHFSTFFLPLFIIYPIIWFLVEKKKRTIKSFLTIILTVIPFLLINYFLISQDPFKPSTDLKLLGSFSSTLDKVILQFSSLNILPLFINKLASIAQPYRNTLIILTIPIIFLYFMGAILIKKREPRLLSIYLTSMIVIPIVLLFNLTLGKVNPSFNINGYHYYYLPHYYIGKIDTLTSIKGDRYYLVPMFFVSFIWSSILYIISKGNRFLIRIIIPLILLFYVFYNTALIWSMFDALQPFTNEVKSYLSYVKSLRNQFSNKTILIVPNYFIWSSGLVSTFYGYPDMRFIASVNNWQREFNSDSLNNVILIDYNYRTKIFLNLSDKLRRNENIKLFSY